MGTQNELPDYTMVQPHRKNKLRKKYTIGGVVKGTRQKGDGNRGNTGRKARAAKRGHGGGQVTAEQRARSEQQSREYQSWRANWGKDEGAQPG